MNSENRNAVPSGDGAAIGDETENKNVTPEKAPEFAMVGQYIKDLSFENPNAPKSLKGPGENPNMQIEINVNAQKVGDHTYEVELHFEAHGKNDAGVIYNLELVYAGLFRLVNFPDDALQPVLFIDCPILVFPFVRRLVNDLTQEGGFPPLRLEPINFAALYQQNLQKQQASNSAPKPV